MSRIVTLKLVGMITDREIVEPALPTGERPDDIPVAQIMIKEVDLL